MKNFFFLILGLTFIFGSIFLYLEQVEVVENQFKTLKINDLSIQVEVADITETRAKGLSGRETLPDGTGMLFIFEKSGFYGFWMKEMLFPIDIIWVDAQEMVVGVEKSVKPETFPQIFYPKKPVKYVLEVPAGFSEKNRIDIGQVVYLDSQSTQLKD